MTGAAMPTDADNPGAGMVMPPVPDAGRRERESQRAREIAKQQGGLDDDPTESGEPVRNKRSFVITGG